MEYQLNNPASLRVQESDAARLTKNLGARGLTAASSVGGRRHGAGPRSPFSRARKRLREIERVIADRHGHVPETDDADVYLIHVAHCFRQIAIDRGKPATVDGIKTTFGFWCRTWAPHVGDERLMEIMREVARSRKLPADDVVGRDFHLSYEERHQRRATAIGAYDVDRGARTRLAKARRQKRNRLRAEKKRRAAGAKPRAVYEANSLSQTKPWEAEGISRSTWERRRKAAAAAAGGFDASPSPHQPSSGGVTHLRQDAVGQDDTGPPLPVVVEQPIVERREPQATRRTPDVIDVVGVHTQRGIERALWRQQQAGLR
jgi:hypothetical protein